MKLAINLNFKLLFKTKSKVSINIKKLCCDLRELKQLQQFDNILICFTEHKPSRRLKFMQIQTRMFFNISKKVWLQTRKSFISKPFKNRTSSNSSLSTFFFFPSHNIDVLRIMNFFSLETHLSVNTFGHPQATEEISREKLKLSTVVGDKYPYLAAFPVVIHAHRHLFCNSCLRHSFFFQPKLSRLVIFSKIFLSQNERKRERKRERVREKTRKIFSRLDFGKMGKSVM